MIQVYILLCSPWILNVDVVGEHPNFGNSNVKNELKIIKNVISNRTDQIEELSEK